MKNLTRISFFALAVLFLVSCGGDDPKPTLNLVGKWSPESTNAALEVNGKPFKDYLISQGQTAAQAEAAEKEIMDQIGELPTLTGTIEFKSDNSFVAVFEDEDGNDESSSGTWKLSDDKKTLTLTDPSDDSNDETLTISDYTSTTFTVKELVDSDTQEGVKLDFFLVLKFKKV